MSAATVSVAPQTQYVPKPKTLFIWGIIGITCYVAAWILMAVSEPRSVVMNFMYQGRNFAILNIISVPFVAQWVVVVYAIFNHHSYARTNPPFVFIGGSIASIAATTLWPVSFATNFIVNPWPTFICAAVALTINVIGYRKSR
ncbi:MAG: hypothetical protein V1916_03420 [Patescibacteria group bacterium]